MRAGPTRQAGRGAVAAALLSTAVVACTCAGRDAAGPTRVPPLAMPSPPVEPPEPIVVDVPPPPPPPPLPATPLEPWFRALEAVEGHLPAAAATVIVVGDSHTASDTYTGQLRDRLQARFGDGGRGMAQPGSPWAAYRQESMTFGQTRGWTVFTGNRREPVPPFGLSGVRLVADGEGERVSRGTCADCRFGRTFDRLTVYTVAHPGGGTVEVLVDGAPIAHIRTDAEATTPLIARFGAPEDGADAEVDDTTSQPPIDRLIDDLVFEDAPHQVELVALGDGEVWLTGVATDRSVGGARVDSFGLNGAVAAQWAAFDPVIVGAEAQSRDAALVVIAFGTNEAYGRQFEVFAGSTADGIDAAIEEERARAHAYTALVGRLIETLQGDPLRTACLVMLPPDFEEEDARCIPTEFSAEAGAAETVCVVPPPRTMEIVRDGLIDAAADVGCAVWDTQRAMGGPGSQSWWQRHDPQWARSDGVHLSVAGYDQIGDAMFADLDAAFARWRAGGDGTLETSPIRARPAER
ncbi:MAG: hypothetical protein H6700_00590 [Myxococcales bacterium]|nr:hypothetical protein [Myxococcales bacterium]